MSDVPHLGEESKTMTPTDKAQALLDRLRALAQEATPGPWVQRPDGLTVRGVGHALVVRSPLSTERRTERAVADAAHIAAASPATVLALVGALESLMGCSASFLPETKEDASRGLARAFDALEPEGGA